MNTVESTVVAPVKSENLKEKNTTRVDPVDLSFQQIEERASTRTEILNAILAKEQKSSWRHWGLNE